MSFEIGNILLLKVNYSRAMEEKFVDWEKEKRKSVLINTRICWKGALSN